MAEPETEADLIARAQAGDAAATERLLLTHYDALRARIATRLPADLQGTVAVEDVLQQTLIAAVQGLASFERRGDGALLAWLTSVAEHRLQDAIKAQRAVKRGGGRVAVPTPDEGTGAPRGADGLLEAIAGSVKTPTRQLAAGEGAAAVRIGLAALHADQRRALELRYLRGLPVEEVAGIMERTPHAIHNLCYRGLRDLHAVLGRTSQYFTKKG